jgi:FtsP/CotA-like multicopper oxidase with cupredoxin domain
VTAHPLPFIRAVAVALLSGVLLTLPACAKTGDDARFEPLLNQPFSEPPELVAVNGQLATRFAVDEGELQVGGVSVRAKSYDGAFPGPTMVVAPGESIRLEFVNNLDEATNIHFHGFHTSPSGIADNVLRTIPAHTTEPVEVPIPPEMPPGVYWYHSHEHGISEEQVFSGLSGAIVVKGVEEMLPPELRGVEQRLMTLKDLQVRDGAIVTKNINSDAPTTRTVNGLVEPSLEMAPGETQMWRFANIGADIWYQLSFAGQPFNVIAEDANPVGQVWTATELLLPPGKRYDVLVVAPAAGQYYLETLAYSTGEQGDSYPQSVLATVTVAGTSVPPVAMPQSLAPLPDIPASAVVRQRTFTFSENKAGTQFYINGEQFDHDRVNVSATLGDTEEWVIKNVSGEEHPFHIHVNDFQLISINGQPYQARSLQDTQPIPVGGEIVIRQRYADYTGRFVYHCHILAHEDNGMMGLIEVSEPGTPSAAGGTAPTVAP